jgi:hypothetical protein
MGRRAKRQPRMTPSGEWLVDQISRLLEPDERDASEAISRNRV